MTNEAGDAIGYLYYSLGPGNLHSARIEICTDGYIGRAIEVDHDTHYFSNGKYRYSELGFSSSQTVLKEGVSLVKPRTAIAEDYLDFNPLVVVLPDFRLDDRVREALFDIPSEQLDLVTKLIGKYL